MGAQLIHVEKVTSRSNSRQIELTILPEIRIVRPPVKHLILIASSQNDARDVRSGWRFDGARDVKPRRQRQMQVDFRRLFARPQFDCRSPVQLRGVRVVSTGNPHFRFARRCPNAICQRALGRPRGINQVASRRHLGKPVRSLLVGFLAGPTHIHALPPPPFPGDQIDPRPGKRLAIRANHLPGNPALRRKPQATPGDRLPRRQMQRGNRMSGRIGQHPWRGVIAGPVRFQRVVARDDTLETEGAVGIAGARIPDRAILRNQPD